MSPSTRSKQKQKSKEEEKLANSSGQSGSHSENESGGYVSDSPAPSAIASSSKRKRRRTGSTSSPPTSRPYKMKKGESTKKNERSGPERAEPSTESENEAWAKAYNERVGWPCTEKDGNHYRKEKIKKARVKEIIARFLSEGYSNRDTERSRIRHTKKLGISATRPLTEASWVKPRHKIAPPLEEARLENRLSDREAQAKSIYAIAILSTVSPAEIDRFPRPIHAVTLRQASENFRS